MLTSLREKHFEMLRSFISHITSVKKDNGSSERLIRKRLIRQEVKCPKTICSTHRNKNIRYVGPMVTQVDKKGLPLREVQSSLYITKNRRCESRRCRQHRYRGRYKRAETTQLAKGLSEAIAPLRHTMSFVDSNHTDILCKLGQSHKF